MKDLIEKIKKYFGDQYTYNIGEQFMGFWIQGKHSNERTNAKSIFLPQADYMDKLGELEEYLKGL